MTPNGDPVAIFLARLSPGSRPTMMGALRWFAKTLEYDDPHGVPWGGFRYQHTGALRGKLAESFAPTTANKMLAALRGVLKEAWRLGQMSAEDYQRTVDFPALQGKIDPRGRSLSHRDIGALFQVCADGPRTAGVRDAAILAIGYGAGLRVSEITSLDLQDYSHETGALLVRGKVHRKRCVFVTNGTKDALDAWIEIRGPEAGPIFWPVNKGGHLKGDRRITRTAINLILRKRARQAGVAEFSAHDLRRSFISELLDRGDDLASVQHLAGHANPQTTARYDRRGGEAKRQVLRLPLVPFHRSSRIE